MNPIDVLLWTFRRNEKDTVNLYNTLSPVMQLTTGGTMLNFGFWSEKYDEPISAQENLCRYFADFSKLSSAKKVADIGSGLSAPSKLWKKDFSELSLYNVNINFDQLKTGKVSFLEMLNSSSTKLPFSDDSLDRVLALESAQHFKPLEDFIRESKRILNKNGLLTLAIPITNGNPSLKELGVLKFTWSSEHYSIDTVKNVISKNGFDIESEEFIGSSVYEPMADYYVKNRDILKKSILKRYSNFVESVLYKSILKMKKASEDGIINYALLRCFPNG